MRFDSLTAWKRQVLVVLGITVLVFVVSLFYQAQSGTLSPQSIANLEFAVNPSFVSAIDTYPTCWPPFYPSVLWFFEKLGIPVSKVNLLFYYFILLLIGCFAKRYIENIHWGYIIIFIIILNTNYVNSYQYVSEPLFVLMTFAVLLMLLQYRQSPTTSKLCWLGVVVSISCLTRFYGFFWPLPLCLVFIWWNNSCKTIRFRLLHTGAFCGIVGVLVSPWLIRLRMLTGSFSGTDRFGPRFSKAYGLLLTNQDSIFTNFKAALKTILVDFLSPHRYASHRVITTSPLSMLETCLAIVALLLLVIMFVMIGSTLYRSLRSPLRGKLADFAFADKIIPSHFALLYFVSIIVLWTLTNNDPIYTRFMYPMYLFAVLSIFSLYSWVFVKNSGLYKKLPFILLFWLVLGVNCYKDLNGLFK